MVGRCTTGYSGAHSWKKMLISWSDTKRGGVVTGWLGTPWTTEVDKAVSASVETFVADLPSLTSLLVKTSANVS